MLVLHAKARSAALLEALAAFEREKVLPAVARARKQMAGMRLEVRPAGDAGGAVERAARARRRGQRRRRVSASQLTRRLTVVDQTQGARKVFVREKLELFERLWKTLEHFDDAARRERAGRVATFASLLAAEERTALLKVRRFDQLRDVMRARKAQLEGALRDRSTAVDAGVFGDAGDAKLRALDPAKKEVAAELELAWLIQRLGAAAEAEAEAPPSSSGQAATQRLLAASRESAAGADLESEVERRWRGLLLVAEYVDRHLRREEDFQSALAASLGKLLSGHRMLASYFDELFAVESQKLEAKMLNDNAALLRLANQETDARIRIASLRRAVNERCTALEAAVRGNMHVLEAATVREEHVVDQRDARDSNKEDRKDGVVPKPEEYRDVQGHDGDDDERGVRNHNQAGEDVQAQDRDRDRDRNRDRERCDDAPKQQDVGEGVERGGDGAQGSALPSASFKFRAVVPTSCSVAQRITPGALLRQVRGDAWTALLPARFFATERMVRSEAALHAKLDDIASQRQWEKEKKADAGASSGDDDDGGDDDDDEDSSDEEAGEARRRELLNADKNGAAVAELLAEARAPAPRQGRGGPSLASVRSAVSNWWNQGKEEEAAILRAVLRKQRREAAEAGPMAPGVSSDMAFTVGQVELYAMEKQQALRLEQRLPGLTRLPRSLGENVPVYLWFRRTTDPTLFVRELLASHAGGAHRLHKKAAHGFSRIGSDAMAGLPGDPGLELLAASGRAFAPQYVTDVRVSGEEEEEEDLAELDYVRVDMDLGDVGLAPETFLWVKMAAQDSSGEETADGEAAGTGAEGPAGAPSGDERRSAASEATLLALDDKRRKVAEKVGLRVEDDAQLYDLIGSIDAEIARVTEQVLEHRKQMLKRATEFLALSKKDLEALVRDFADMDRDGSGEVSVQELLAYARIPDSPFSRRVFGFLDRNSDGSLDFPELLNMLSTFCMFGAAEVAKMCFMFLDPNDKGLANTGAAEKLIGQMHGVDHAELPIALNAVKYLGSMADDGNLFSATDFYNMHRKFPGALMPAAQIQDALRRRFFGRAWWAAKMLKYAKAREVARKMAKLEHLTLPPIQP